MNAWRRHGFLELIQGCDAVSLWTYATMSFSERAKLISLAIVKIFETSKPFGNYSAVAVLNDGAGISYGTSQFTHRSGSLAAVITRYVKLGGYVGVDEMAEHLPDLKAKRNIPALSKNAALKNALKRAGETPEMQRAQREIAFENYLKPAIEACEGSDFEMPLSLAVIYDSINHGSYEKIRDKVTFTGPSNGSIKPEEFEREWITRYVKKRDAWLESVPRLAATDYRTDFFLAQIARENWQLKLPMTVHGFRLTEEILFPKAKQTESFAKLKDDEINLEIPENPSAAIGQQSAEASSHKPVTLGDLNDQIETTAADSSGTTQQVAETITITGDAPIVPPGFEPQTVAVTAPPATGFIAKIKAQIAALLVFVGGGAGLKEYFNVTFSAEIVEILKVLLPVVFGLGFIGVLVWFVVEKIVGFKTMQMKAGFRADPNSHNIAVIPGDTERHPRWAFWR